MRAWFHEYLGSLENLSEHLGKRPRLCLAALGMLLAIQISPWWYTTYDGCTYLSLARSMAHGESLQSFESARGGNAPTYPLLISPALRVTDRPFLLLSVVNWVLAVVLMLGVYHWGRRQFPDAALLITGLTMLNIAVWYYCRRTTKEIAFMAALIWAANALNALLRSRGLWNTLRCIVVVGLALLLTISIRYSAIVLLAGFATALGLVSASRRELSLRSVGVGLALAAFSMSALYALTRTGEHIIVAAFQSWKSGLASRVLEGLRIRISEIGRLTIPGMYKSYSRTGDWLNINVGIYLIVLVIVSLGWWRLVRRKRDVLALSLPFYFALYVLWPYDQGARFMVSMIPVLMACVWFGSRSFVPRPAAAFALLLVAHFGATMSYWIVRDAPRAYADQQYWPAIDQIASEIGNNDKPVAVAGVPLHVRYMLKYALDRPIGIAKRDRVPLASTGWVIQPVNAVVPDRFAVRSVSGKLALCVRTPRRLSRTNHTVHTVRQ